MSQLCGTTFPARLDHPWCLVVGTRLTCPSVVLWIQSLNSLPLRAERVVAPSRMSLPLQIFSTLSGESVIDLQVSQSVITGC